MKWTFSLLSVFFVGSASFASYFSYDSAEFSSQKDTAGVLHRSFYFKGSIIYHSDTGEALPVSIKTNNFFICSALTGLSWRNQVSGGGDYIKSFRGLGPINPVYTNFTKTALIGQNGEIERVVFQNDSVLQTSDNKGVNRGMSYISCSYEN